MDEKTARAFQLMLETMLKMEASQKAVETMFLDFAQRTTGQSSEEIGAIFEATKAASYQSLLESVEDASAQPAALVDTRTLAQVEDALKAQDDLPPSEIQ